MSTGPRTTEGKFASSRNATKHGLASGTTLLPGEDPAAFEALLSGLQKDHQPANSTEQLLVTQIAQSYWLAQRAIHLQNDCFTETGVDEKRLALFLRYGTTHNRAFHKALADLQRLQKERRKLDCGFVSQTTAQAAPPNQFVRQNTSPVEPKFGFVSQTNPAEDPERSTAAAKAA